MTSAVNQAAADALAAMTDVELAAWVDAGDYSTIRGVALSEDTSAQLAAIVNEADVEGFIFDTPPDPNIVGDEMGAMIRKAGGSPGSEGKPFLRFKFATVFTTKVD